MHLIYALEISNAIEYLLIEYHLSNKINILFLLFQLHLPTVISKSSAKHKI